MVGRDRVMSCKHEAFRSWVGINRQTQIEGGPVTSFSAEIRIRCRDCGTSFFFLGLPVGSDPSKPMVSRGSETLRAPIAPGPDPSTWDDDVAGHA